MTEAQEAIDQAEQKSVEKTSQRAAVSGVIDGQANQEIHGEAHAASHANDKTLSEPDMIAMEENETVAEYKARMAQIQANRFGFFDSEAETKVYEKPATQALEPMPALPPVLSEGPYKSTVKLNVQITNVPEVSEGIKPEEALQHLNQAFEAGAESVRPVKDWMATQNAVSDALVSIGPALDNAVKYYSNTPTEQVRQDTETLIGQAADDLNKAFSYAQTPAVRAHNAGNLMPFFFFDGDVKEPVHPQTIGQLGLESMNDSELAALNIRRITLEASDLHMPEVPEHLKHLELQAASPQLLDSMKNKGREFLFAEPGSEEFRYLLAQRVEASTGRTDMMHILMKENPTKIAALEEFLHGTQKKIGLIDKVGEEIAEVRVKDFMLRHQRLLGLTDNDSTVLEALRQQEANYALRRGFSPRLFKVGGHE